MPVGIVATGAEAPRAAKRLGFPVALKLVSAGLPHKSEVGAVRLGLRDLGEVEAAVAGMRADVTAHNSAAVTDRFLVERMAGTPVAELMVSVRADPDFGLAMTIASGGVLVELIDDAVTLLLPAAPTEIARALAGLRVSRLLNGYRGRPAADRDAVIDALQLLAAYALARPEVAEIEVNPLFVLARGVVAVDVLMRVDPAARP